VSLFLLLRRPEKGYPLVLLFFGFFLTMAVTVNAMALVQVLNDDPAVETMGAGQFIFPVMAVLFLVGLYYLIRHRGNAMGKNDLAA
jgi:low temperature requirement protein LtrA